jgi:hypothetical protein
LVKLYFLHDDSALTPPAQFQLQRWHDDGWTDVAEQRRTPAEPEGRRANIVAFDRIVTDQLRLVLTHRPDASSGLSELEAWAHVDLPLPQPTAQPSNIAFGASARASFTGTRDRVEQVNDMQVAFTRYSRNRWTAFGTPNTDDWVELDFGQMRAVRQVDLYLYGDDRGVRAPRGYRIQYRAGDQWRDATVEYRLPEKPATSAVNVVRVTPVETDRLRIVFEHDAPAVTGVTEIMVWR